MILMKRALSFSIYLSSDFLRLIIIITTAKPIELLEPTQLRGFNQSSCIIANGQFDGVSEWQYIRQRIRYV